MDTPPARPFRWLAGSAAIGLCALAAAAAPALASGSARPAQRHSDTTITLRYYSTVVSLVLVKADGTVVQQPTQAPAAGDRLEILELAYKGTHARHAAKWSASSHTTCVFKDASAAPTCDGQTAVGGSQLVLFHTPSDGDAVVSGGTGRYAGATGTVVSKEIGNTNNSDIVVTVHLAQ